MSKTEDIEFHKEKVKKALNILLPEYKNLINISQNSEVDVIAALENSSNQETKQQMRVLKGNLYRYLDAISSKIQGFTNQENPAAVIQEVSAALEILKDPELEMISRIDQATATLALDFVKQSTQFLSSLAEQAAAGRQPRDKEDGGKNQQDGSGQAAAQPTISGAIGGLLQRMFAPRKREAAPAAAAGAPAAAPASPPALPPPATPPIPATVPSAPPARQAGGGDPEDAPFPAEPRPPSATAWNGPDPGIDDDPGGEPWNRFGHPSSDDPIMDETHGPSDYRPGYHYTSDDYEPVDLPGDAKAGPVDLLRDYGVDGAENHDFDWAVIEPSSILSIVQTAGRVNRHHEADATPAHPAVNLFAAAPRMPGADGIDKWRDAQVDAALEKAGVAGKQAKEVMDGFTMAHMGVYEALRDTPEDGHSGILIDWFDKNPQGRDKYIQDSKELKDFVDEYSNAVAAAVENLVTAGRRDEADKLLAEYKGRIETPNDWLGTVTGFDYRKFADQILQGMEDILQSLKSLADRLAHSGGGGNSQDDADAYSGPSPS